MKSACVFKFPVRLFNGVTISSNGVVYVALNIGRTNNIYCWWDCRDCFRTTRRNVVVAGVEKLGQYIVLIRCTNQLANRQTHLLQHSGKHETWVSDCVRFNVPLDTLQAISGTIFTGQMTKPTVSKHWRKLVGCQRSGLNPTRTTPPCYNNATLGNRLYAQRKGPNVTNPIYLTCKNCSHKCAADCEHCVTQSSTELFW